MTKVVQPKMSSITNNFDQLMRSLQVLNDPAEIRFLEFLESVQSFNAQAKVQHLQEDIQRLQKETLKGQAEIRTLELKLKNARHLLDLEKAKRNNTEKEKNDLASQIGMVMDMLGQGQVNETKERLKQLHSFTLGSSLAENRRSTATVHQLSPGPGGLSTITESNDTQGSVLSISDIDITEDDLDIEESRTRSGRSFKRKSEEEDKSQRKSRRSGQTSDMDKENLVSADIRLSTNHHEVNFNIKPSAPPLPDNEVEIMWERQQIRTPMSARRQAPQPPVAPHTPKNPIILTAYSPMHQNLFTPNTNSLLFSPPMDNKYTPVMTPQLRNHSSTSKVNGRQHAFYTKTIYKTESCQPCGKRIKFGKVALKCRDCRATCHQECRESVPLPCVPTATTPSTKGHLGLIADFTTLVSPMVPAIVVHITNEVEKRGLNEVGIYRVPGADKEVKGLKTAILWEHAISDVRKGDEVILCTCIGNFRTLLISPVFVLLMRNFLLSSSPKSPLPSHSAVFKMRARVPPPVMDARAWLVTPLLTILEPGSKQPEGQWAGRSGP
ncbi:unnamed protein product, partial [Meganyctiphanes norvegica]